MIRDVFSLLLFFLTLMAALFCVKALSRRPLALLWPAAIGVLVAYESILFNLLSLFRAVTPFFTLLGHLTPLVALTVVNLRSRRPVLGFVLTPLRRLRRLNPAVASLLPLAVILTFVAAFFPPSNWDGMTYHMARVAHWIQNLSIAYFSTSNERQNWLSPGAEYLILALQLLAGSDRWANSVQLICWFSCVPAVPALCRLAGVPGELCAWAAVWVLVTPMVVFQASSVQNDLVAGALVLAVITCCLPFMHRRAHWGRGDLWLLSIVLGAAFLVKPTSVVIALPVVVFAGVAIGFWLTARRRSLATRAGWLAAAGLVGLCIIGPDSVRKMRAPRPPWVGDVLFQASFTELRARLFNVGAGAAHHLAPQRWTLEALKRLGRFLGLPPVESAMVAAPAGTTAVFGKRVFTWHEDFTGNPLQVVMVVACVAAVPFVWRRIGWRRRVLGLLPVGGWIMFHVVFRDNPWLTRLQVPLFVIGPLTWVVAYGSRLGIRVLKGGAVLCAAYGYVCATNEMGKNLGVWSVLTTDRDSYYYNYNPTVKSAHDHALKTLTQVACDRLGLDIGSDSYDYPLSWRAMRMGASVRQYRTPGGWPCVVFSENGERPRGVSDAGWRDEGQGVFAYSRPPEGR